MSPWFDSCLLTDVLLLSLVPSVMLLGLCMCMYVVVAFHGGFFVSIGALRFYKFFIPEMDWDVEKTCTSAVRGTKVEYAPVEVAAASASPGSVPSLAVAHADLEPHPDPSTVRYCSLRRRNLST